MSLYKLTIHTPKSPLPHKYYLCDNYKDLFNFFYKSLPDGFSYSNIEDNPEDIIFTKVTNKITKIKISIIKVNL